MAIDVNQTSKYHHYFKVNSANFTKGAFSSDLKSVISKKFPGPPNYLISLLKLKLTKTSIILTKQRRCKKDSSDFVFIEIFQKKWWVINCCVWYNI